MSKHKHAESMPQYAQDAAETDKSWKRWQIRFRLERTCKTLGGSPQWFEDAIYKKRNSPEKHNKPNNE